MRRVVVKIGSQALLGEGLALDRTLVHSIADQICGLREAGFAVTLVSSGAVAAGLPDLGLDTRPDDVPSLQAAAAAGQTRLMDLYRRAFLEHGRRVAQILLTHSDLRSRERHLNARNTLGRLLEAGITPIVNENDTVAVDEIRFGDNDMLASLVAALIGAELLIILGTVDGLLSRPPGEGGEVIPVVDEIDDGIRAMVGGGTTFGRGGMATKLDAADMITRCGGTTVFASAREADVLARITSGESVGTTFTPRGAGMPGRKRWIAFFDRPQGRLHLDAGATRAIVEQGSSLLAVGIRSTDGEFDRGAPVRLLDPSGDEFARGLVNYPADDLRRIQGRASDEIPDLLGRREYEEVVHRDNLVVIG